MKNIVALIKYAVVVDSTFLKMYLITNVGKIGKKLVVERIRQNCKF